jgi:hypothetical protein
MAAIQIAALRTEIDRLLDLFLQNGLTEVELEADWYWEVGWDDRYLKPGEPSEDPKPGIGSLLDDLEFLTSGYGEQAVALQLCHAAPLLNYLGVRSGNLGVFVGAAIGPKSQE